MHRRSFVKNGFLSFSSLAAVAGASGSEVNRAQKPANPFKLKFSPDYGIFNVLGGTDAVDYIKWVYDQGFRAFENTMLIKRPVQEQERISACIQRLGMEFGQFVGTMSFTEVTFAGNSGEKRQQVIREVKESVEIAKRMRTKFVHNVLGMADRALPYETQMLNAAELLKRIADIYEPHGIVMVMETMNHKVNHGGMFLRTIPQAYALAKMVNRPSVKILYDAYHVQIEEGNLLPAFDAAYDEIAYVQIGDTPGRYEPSTGEINYSNVLKYIYNKGYKGFIGLEHWIKNPTAEGERSALNAYRQLDIP